MSSIDWMEPSISTRGKEPDFLPILKENPNRWARIAIATGQMEGRRLYNQARKLKTTWGLESTVRKNGEDYWLFARWPVSEAVPRQKRQYRRRVPAASS